MAGGECEFGARGPTTHRKNATRDELSVVETEPVQGWLAPAPYWSRDAAAKLAAPSFERYTSGLKATLRGADAGPGIRAVPARYETHYRDDLYGGSSAAFSATVQPPATGVPTRGPMITVNEGIAYTVASVDDLVPVVELPRISGYQAASLAPDEIRRRDPARATQLQVIALHEAA